MGTGSNLREKKVAQRKKKISMKQIFDEGDMAKQTNVSVFWSNPSSRFAHSYHKTQHESPEHCSKKIGFPSDFFWNGHSSLLAVWVHTQNMSDQW